MNRKGGVIQRYSSCLLTLLGLFLLLGGGCGNNNEEGGVKPPPPQSTGNKLNVQITDATIPADRKPVVTFKITDDQGNPLDRKALAPSLRFIIARIEKGNDQYTNYITLVQTSPITGQSGVQADSEGSRANPLGTFADQGNGVSTYTFNTALPENFDKSVTHTVGIFATATINGRVYVSNATFNFIPSGGTVTTVRDVVRTENCNSCHDPLQVHGGARRDVKLCVLCHTTEIIDPKTGQSVEQVDPDTGNNIGLEVMIHKIHRGGDLPSFVLTGKPYQIIGFQQSVNDFSNVGFPQDIRNCTKCHTGGTESDHFKKMPARDSCGSCHDDVNFASGGTNFPGGMSHGGGIQLDDNNCSGCHLPSTGKEFDLSVVGAHTIPTKSTQLQGVNFQIIGVESAENGSTTVAPGEHPKVTFKITTDSGQTILPSNMNFLRLTLSGPTTDYNIQDFNGDGKKTPGVENEYQEDATKGASGPDSSGNFTYTFKGQIPSDGTGTYVTGIEGYKCGTVQGSNQAKGGINCDGTLDLNHNGIEDNGEVFNQVRVAGHNVEFYFPVTDSQAVPRRKIADDATTCINCHGVFSKDFSIHGGIRNDLEYCILCHNPSADDIPFRAPTSGTQQRTTSINFRVLIHKIHTGENLTNKPYIIIGFRGSVNDFSDIAFPGDRGDCQECHLDQTFILNPGHGILGNGILPTTERQIDSSKNVTKTFLTTPIVSTCTSCHDNLGVNAAGDGLTGENHSIKNIVASENECVTCHGAGAAVDVQNVHLPFLPPDQRIGRPEDPNINEPSP